MKRTFLAALVLTAVCAQGAPYVWLHGFWCFDWYDAVIPVASINTASNSITFAAQHQYGVRAGNPSPRRWRAVHLLEELDMPGEYYVDRDAKKLYLYPPASFGKDSRVVLGAKWRHLLAVANGTDIVFRGIDFTECQADAVLLKRCTRVSLENCRLYNIRCKAVYAEGCTDCRLVPGADLYRKIPGFKPIPFEKIGLLTRRGKR